MQSIRVFSQQWISDTHTLPKGNSWPNPYWKLVWVQWKQLSPNPWGCNGHKNGSVFCKYLHGGDWNKPNPTIKVTPSQENGSITMTFSPFGTLTEKMWNFLLKNWATKFHPTIKFTTEISENKITFLDTTVFKGERFTERSILDIKTPYKPTETFQYTHFTSRHPSGVKRGFIKGEAIRLLIIRINSSKTTFDESVANFKQHLEARGYPKLDIERSLSEVNFDQRQLALKQKQKSKERLLPFVTTYHPAVQVDLKKTLMANWSLIEN